MSEEMESVEFQVDVTERDLLNFKLYHNYHSVSGIATFVFGVICLVICVISYGNYNIAYTLMMAFFGLFFTVYTPIGMKFKVHKLMKNAKGAEPVTYTVNGDGITLSQGEVTEKLAWNEVFRVKASGSSVILYISSVRANVIPYRCLGDKAGAFVDIVQSKLTVYQVKLNKKKVVEKCSRLT